jgi:hypothetical protein
MGKTEYPENRNQSAKRKNIRRMKNEKQKTSHKRLFNTKRKEVFKNHKLEKVHDAGKAAIAKRTAVPGYCYSDRLSFPDFHLSASIQKMLP